MIYNYPRPQEVYNDSLFLIAETVDCNKFSEYNIPYRKGREILVKHIQHDFLKTSIDRGIVTLLHKPGSFNGKEYYRIPLQIQLTLI